MVNISKWKTAAVIFVSLQNISYAGPAEQAKEISKLLETLNCESCDLSRGDLNGTDLPGASLVDATLDGANLSGVNLSGADLRGASLIGTNLQGAILTGADLSYTNLSKANLSASQLFDTTLRGANLSNADLRWAKLRKTDIGQAVLADANLTNAYVASWIDDGSIFCRTIEPNGTIINRDCNAQENDLVMGGGASNTSAPIFADQSQPSFSSARLSLKAADWTIISDTGHAQRLLKKLGFSLGPIDGVWGQKTSRALKTFLDKQHISFDGTLGGVELSILVESAEKNEIKPHPHVNWDYRSTSIDFGGYDMADEPVFQMIKTIKEIPKFGFNVLSIGFRCTGKIDVAIPEFYPLGRRIGCSIPHRQVSIDEGFSSIRSDATSLAIDEAQEVGLAVNLSPSFAELARRFVPRDADGYGKIPVEVFFKGDGVSWSGFIPIIMEIAHYAEENKVEYLTIGGEFNNFNSKIEEDSRWSDIFNDLRAVYTGKIIYNHNYNNKSNLREISRDSILRQVDIVGLNFYPSLMLGGKSEYTAEEVAQGFINSNSVAGRNMMSEAAILASTLKVPIILSESVFPTWVGSANWIFRGGCDYQNEGLQGWQYVKGPLQAKIPSDEHGRLLATGFMLAFEDEKWVHGANYLSWSSPLAYDERTDAKEYGPCTSWLWNSDDGIKELVRDFQDN